MPCLLPLSFCIFQWDIYIYVVAETRTSVVAYFLLGFLYAQLVSQLLHKHSQVVLDRSAGGRFVADAGRME